MVVVVGGGAGAEATGVETGTADIMVVVVGGGAGAEAEATETETTTKLVE